MDPPPDEPETEPPPPRRTLRKASRLTGRNAFGPVFAARLRRDAGPLVVRCQPNGLGFHRLGVSVPEKVGNAVRGTGGSGWCGRRSG